MTIGRPTIVLVEPQNPANIGFVARVVDNFDAGGWIQVGGVDWRNSEAERTGAPARHRLEELRRVETWNEAVAECTHLIAMTARPRRHRKCFSLEELGEFLRDWGADAKVGLVFGREDRGLETDEVDRCTVSMTIPTNGLTSLNLSHAVGLALYEWDRGAGPTSTSQLAWAGAEARTRLLHKFAEELERMQFPSANTELEDLLRRLEGVPIETRDLRVLEKIVRHVRHLRDSVTD